MITSLCAGKYFFCYFFFSNQSIPKVDEALFPLFKDAIVSKVSKDADIWTSSEPKFLMSFLTCCLSFTSAGGWKVRKYKPSNLPLQPLRTHIKSCIYRAYCSCWPYRHDKRQKERSPELYWRSWKAENRQTFLFTTSFVWDDSIFGISLAFTLLLPQLPTFCVWCTRLVDHIWAHLLCFSRLILSVIFRAFSKLDDSYKIVLFLCHSAFLTVKIRPLYYAVVILVVKFIHCGLKRKKEITSKSRCSWLQLVFLVEIFHISDAPICVALPQVISELKRCDICSSLMLLAGQHRINHCCQMQMQPVTKRQLFPKQFYVKMKALCSSVS